MRALQVVIFFLALATSVAALAFAGTNTGDILWRIGVAALLLDLVSMMLWPHRARG